MTDWSEVFEGNIPAKSKKGGKKGGGLSCADCGLDQNCNSPGMEAHGKGERGVVWVGEAPGEMEDEVGKQWQGRVGKALRKTLLYNFDFNLFNDAVCINAVNCRPPDNRTPDPIEIACCRSRVLKVIKDVQPKVIVAAGASAVESLIGPRWQEATKLMQWRGWTIPDREYGAWLCPIFHPSYVERSKADMPQVTTIHLQDLGRALSCLTKPLPSYKDERSCLKIVTDEDDLTERLGRLLRNPPEKLAFDFETTGLKPYVNGHQIICMSIAHSCNKVFTFQLPPKGSKNHKMIVELLEHPSIWKMAHNLQFEDTWSRVILGAKVNPWLWDSMVAAHILDNRKKVTGLKFQAYVNFGIVDYSSDITPFLKPKGKSANSFNQIMDLIDKEPHGMDRLLRYCGMDSLLEYRLADEQMARLDPPERERMHEGGN